MRSLIRPATTADIDALFEIRTSVVQNHLSREQMLALDITPASLAQAIEAAPCAWLAEAEAALFARHSRIWLETDGRDSVRANGFYRRLGWAVVEQLEEGDVRYEKARQAPA